MRISKAAIPAVLGVLVIGVLAWSLRAEAPAEAPKEGPGRFDPQEFRRMMSERMRETLGASEEEWKVLEPKIDAVQTAAREVRGGGFGPGGPGGFGPGGPGGRMRGGERGQATPESPVAKATQDLRTALEDTSATAEAIVQKLAALRKARDAARENLAKAQADLRELLTKRQEAQLVLMGILD